MQNLSAVENCKKKYQTYRLMILYYKIATEKNPSLRSIPWAIGFLAGFYFMIDLGVYLLL